MVKKLVNEIKWYVKQLIPFTYRTTYSENNKKYFCVWNMWLGRSYNVDKYEIRG